MNLNEWRSRTYDIDIADLWLLIKCRLPGIAICLIAVMAAIYITEHYGGPLILLALLLGMSLNNLHQQTDYQPGLDFCASTLLRLGVALLGVRMLFADVAVAGHAPYSLSLLGTVGTLSGALLLGRIFKVDLRCSLISGAAVAICGISAAVAVCAVLPMGQKQERHLLCTIAGIAGLSTLAMVILPAFTQQLGLSETQTGIMLGAVIHDVAQVAGAGYMISEPVGDLAIYTKMIRVALLLPLVLLLAYCFKSENTRFTPPFFLVGFIALAILSNLKLLPELMIHYLKNGSQLCLLLAMVALGARTNLVTLCQMGWRPFALLFGSTAIITSIALVFLSYQPTIQ